MGAWGTGIFQNDTSADVYAEFKQLFNMGVAPTDIRERLEEEYSAEDDEEIFAEFWTAIAYAQWMTGGIEERTLEKLKEVLSKGTGLSLWNEVPSDLTQRRKAIDSLLKKIGVPRSTALKPRRIVPRAHGLEVGDIVAIQLTDDRYTAGIIVSSYGDGLDESCTIVFTNILSDQRPTAEAVLQANVMYVDDIAPYWYYAGYFWGICAARNMNRRLKYNSVVGRTTIGKYLSIMQGIPFLDWRLLSGIYFAQEALERVRSTRCPEDVTIADFLSGGTQEQQRCLIEHSQKLFVEQLQRSIQG